MFLLVVFQKICYQELLQLLYWTFRSLEFVPEYFKNSKDINQLVSL